MQAVAGEALHALERECVRAAARGRHLVKDRGGVRLAGGCRREYEAQLVERARREEGHVRLAAAAHQQALDAKERAELAQGEREVKLAGTGEHVGDATLTQVASIRRGRRFGEHLDNVCVGAVGATMSRALPGNFSCRVDGHIEALLGIRRHEIAIGCGSAGIEPERALADEALGGHGAIRDGVCVKLPLQAPVGSTRFECRRIEHIGPIDAAVEAGEDVADDVWTVAHTAS